VIAGVFAPASRPAAPSSDRRGSFLRDAAAWSAGKSWMWRALLLAYLAWAGFRHLCDPLYGSLFAGITLGIHELGHLLFAFAGRFVGISGGSVAQLAAPAAAAAILWSQRDYFGLTVASAWEAFSLWNLATYVGDARARELPLVSLSSEPIHDWNYLLGPVGLLAWDHALAGMLRGAAFLLWVAAILWGAWLCRTMASIARRAPARSPHYSPAIGDRRPGGRRAAPRERSRRGAGVDEKLA